MKLRELKPITPIDIARVLLGRMQDILKDPQLDWSQKYNCIFSNTYSRLIYREFPNFEYYDPDTSYEEDVRAFVNGFENYINNNLS